ncbi:MAG: hypothetical protein CMK09_11425 [Ponticaulis sp.]|nr:hypothetical protein [Ponticaulis sp.]|tara:strand:- start:15536 stop:17257 length:1722 start_codon:yes stop_codon:yes gene_type:complete
MIGFLKDKRGNVAMILAMCLLPIVIIMGGAVDLSRQRGGETRAQDALDAALLAVARGGIDRNDSELTKDGRQWFETHLGSTPFVIQNFRISKNGETLRADVTGSVESVFLGIIGISDLKVVRSAEVQTGLTKIELALVLDTTGSMRQTPSGQSKTKLASMQDAALKMVDVLDALSKDDSMIEIGIVPFATYVNVGPENANANWMDTNAESPIHADNLVTGLNRFDLYKHLGYDWKGCVATRPAPHDVRDTKPRKSRPETLFVPLFHPDEPDKDGWYEDYPNNYVEDAKSLGVGGLIDLGNPVKYGLPWEVITLIDGLAPDAAKKVLIDLGLLNADGTCTDSTLDINLGGGQECNEGSAGSALNPDNWSPVSINKDYDYYSDVDTEIGPGFSCEMSPIMPLTSKYQQVKTAIRGLNASGSTNISEGMAWGHRVVSPGAPFKQGDRYSSSVQKVVVLLSDGNNMIKERDGHPGGSDFSSYGYIENGRLEGVSGWYDQGEILDAMDDRTLKACAAAKKNGIRIFTIRLALEDDRSEELLTACASEPEDFIDVQNSDELEAAFKDIADRISTLYLSH